VEGVFARPKGQLPNLWMVTAVAVDSISPAAMPRQSRAAPLNPEPSYSVWKADAVKVLQKLHERAVRSTRDGFWTRCYVRNLSPERAAELAAREYDATTRPTGSRGGGDRAARRTVGPASCPLFARRAHGGLSVDQRMSRVATSLWPRADSGTAAMGAVGAGFGASVSVISLSSDACLLSYNRSICLIL
jgi:hypothetical protein